MGALGGYIVYIISHPTSCVIWYPVYSSEAEFPPLLQIILTGRSPLSELELDRQVHGQDQETPAQKLFRHFLAAAVEGAAVKVLSIPIYLTLGPHPLPLALGEGE